MATPTPVLKIDKNTPPFLFLNEYQHRLEDASNTANETQSDASIANFSNILQETESVTANLSNFVSTMGITSSKSAPYVWTQQWQQKSPFDEKIVRDVVMKPTAERDLSLAQASMILASERLNLGATRETLLNDFPKHGLCEVRSAFLCSEAALVHNDLETATLGYNDAIQLFPFVSIFHRRCGMLAWHQGDSMLAKVYFEVACATKNLNWLTGDSNKVRPVLLTPIPESAGFIFYQFKLYVVPHGLDYIATFIYHDRMYTILNSLILRLWIDFKVPEIIGTIGRLLARIKKPPKGQAVPSYVPIMSNIRYKILKCLFRIQVLEERSKLTWLDDIIGFLKHPIRK